MRKVHRETQAYAYHLIHERLQLLVMLIRIAWTLYDAMDPITLLQRDAHRTVGLRCC